MIDIKNISEVLGKASDVAPALAGKSQSAAGKPGQSGDMVTRGALTINPIFLLNLITRTCTPHP